MYSTDESYITLDSRTLNENGSTTMKYSNGTENTMRTVRNTEASKKFVENLTQKREGLNQNTSIIEHDSQ